MFTWKARLASSPAQAPLAPGELADLAHRGQLEGVYVSPFLPDNKKALLLLDFDGPRSQNEEASGLRALCVRAVRRLFQSLGLTEGLDFWVAATGKKGARVGLRGILPSRLIRTEDGKPGPLRRLVSEKAKQVWVSTIDRAELEYTKKLKKEWEKEIDELKARLAALDTARAEKKIGYLNYRTKRKAILKEIQKTREKLKKIRTRRKKAEIRVDLLLEEDVGLRNLPERLVGFGKNGKWGSLLRPGEGETIYDYDSKCTPPVPLDNGFSGKLEGEKILSALLSKDRNAAVRLIFGEKRKRQRERRQKTGKILAEWIREILPEGTESFSFALRRLIRRAVLLERARQQEKWIGFGRGPEGEEGIFGFLAQAQRHRLRELIPDVPSKNDVNKIQRLAVGLLVSAAGGTTKDKGTLIELKECPACRQLRGKSNPRHAFIYRSERGWRIKCHASSCQLASSMGVLEAATLLGLFDPESFSSQGDLEERTAVQTKFLAGLGTWDLPKLLPLERARTHVKNTIDAFETDLHSRVLILGAGVSTGKTTSLLNFAVRQASAGKLGIYLFPHHLLGEQSYRLACHLAARSEVRCLYVKRKEDLCLRLKTCGQCTLDPEDSIPKKPGCLACFKAARDRGYSEALFCRRCQHHPVSAYEHKVEVCPWYAQFKKIRKGTIIFLPFSSFGTIIQFLSLLNIEPDFVIFDEVHEALTLGKIEVRHLAAILDRLGTGIADSNIEAIRDWIVQVLEKPAPDVSLKSRPLDPPAWVKKSVTGFFEEIVERYGLAPNSLGVSLSDAEEALISHFFRLRKLPPKGLSVLLYSLNAVKDGRARIVVSKTGRVCVYPKTLKWTPPKKCKVILASATMPSLSLLSRFFSLCESNSNRIRTEYVWGIRQGKMIGLRPQTKTGKDLVRKGLNPDLESCLNAAGQAAQTLGKTGTTSPSCAFISYKDLALAKDGHFGGLTGLNHLEDRPALIILGRSTPPPEEFAYWDAICPGKEEKRSAWWLISIAPILQTIGRCRKLFETDQSAVFLIDYFVREISLHLLPFVGPLDLIVPWSRFKEDQTRKADAMRTALAKSLKGEEDLLSIFESILARRIEDRRLRHRTLARLENANALKIFWQRWWCFVVEEAATEHIYSTEADVRQPESQALSFPDCRDPPSSETSLPGDSLPWI